MEALSTIGYERAGLEEFLATLRAHRADVLLDVREAPTSRRREFAKKALSTAVGEAGLTYRHEGALGAPRPLRDRMKQGDCDYAEFFARYEEHLSGKQARLDALVAELGGHVVLMCYERDVAQCHRQSVARALETRTGLTARHLIPGPTAEDAQFGLFPD